jgi:hypothetical protein
MADDDFTALIPELPAWNNGAGIAPDAWIGCMGSYQLAVGYSLVFWPRFVRHGDYVLRDGFSESALRSCETGCDARGVEALMNHVHIADLHVNDDPPSEAQLRYLGRVLQEIHRLKLAADFPDLTFEVVFDDTPGLDPLDYQLTFWQVRE